MVYQIKDKADLDAKLEEAGEKLVVLDFFATWCGPCKMISPKLEELATELANSILVYKIDVDECEELAMLFNISSMPTFIFMKNKEKLETFTGANYDKVKATVTKFQ